MPEDGETDVLGEFVEDLQSGVEINDGIISGTLKYTTGYTGFSGKTEEQSGYYLVLKAATDDVDDVITVELKPGTVGHPVTLDSDRNIVLRITSPMTQKVIVRATHGGETVTQTYHLHGLTLANA